MGKNYTFRETSLEEAGKFGEAFGRFQQTKEWAEFRSFYKTSPIMGFDGDVPVLSCIVYRLPVYLTPFSVGYATRAPICDWKNEELLAAFFAFYKKYAKEHRIVYTIFDPDVDRRINFGDTVSPDPCKLLEDQGLIHIPGGGMQPSNNYRLTFDPTADHAAEKQRIYSRYTPGLRTDIENAQNRGVSLEKYHENDLEYAIDVFYRLFEETHRRKGFGARDKDYYLRFAQHLSPYVTIYLYRYDHQKDIRLTRTAVDELQKKINALSAEYDAPETTEKRRKRIEPTKRELESQLAAKEKRIAAAEEHKDDPYLSAWFFLLVGNQSHYLYGANSGVLRDLKLTSTYHDMVEDSIDAGVCAMNMGGSLKMTTEKIEDDPMYDVYLHKSKHNGEFVEMPGEYFLITYPRLFRLLHDKLNYFRRVVFRKK